MLRPPPPLYLVAAGIAQQLLSPKRRPSAPRAVAGGLLAAGSVGLAASASVAFRRHHTTINPVDPGRATALVAEGPFRLTRNPMYVGMAGLLAAHVVTRGGWATLVPLAGFVALIDRTQIPAEEQALAERFGPAYEEYRGSVPRWLGPVRRR